MKMQNFESSCYRTGKYTVCRRFRAFFSREILQAVAVKGLRQPLCGTAFGEYSCLLCFSAIRGSGPVYHSELLHAYTPSRTLRSSSDTCMLEIQ